MTMSSSTVTFTRVESSSPRHDRTPPVASNNPEVAERSSRELLCVDQVERDEVVANGLGSLERGSHVVKRPGSSNQKRSAIVSTGRVTCAGATGPSSDASTGTTPGLMV
jgi:hypothetical protein